MTRHLQKWHRIRSRLTNVKIDEACLDKKCSRCVMSYKVLGASHVKPTLDTAAHEGFGSGAAHKSLCKGRCR